MDLPRGADAHRDGLERAAPRAFDEVGDADAEMTSCLARGGLAPREIVPARARERLMLAFRIVAAIELDRQPAARLELRFIRHLPGRDEIAPAHFRPVEPHLARDAVE